MKIHTDTFNDQQVWKTSILDKLNIRGVIFTDIEYYTAVVDDLDDDGKEWRFVSRFYKGTDGTNSYEAPILDVFIKSWTNCYHLILKLDGKYEQLTRSFPEAEEKAKGIIEEIKALFEEKQSNITHKESSL